MALVDSKLVDESMTVPDLDAGPGLVDDHVGVCQDQAVTLHDEARPVADSDWLARVVIPHAAILKTRLG